MSRGAALVDARAARSERRRLDYEARKVDGRCTREGCDALAVDGSDKCEVCGPRVREQNRQGAKVRRARRRAQGRCIDCGAKSPTCQCVDCQIKTGRIAKRALSRIIADSGRTVSRPALATTIEKDPRYPSGRIRTRYRGGQGRRGAPSRTAIDAADVALALACLRRAHEKLEQLCGIADKRARAAARAEAMGQVALAGRMIDEVLDRSGVSDPP